MSSVLYRQTLSRAIQDKIDEAFVKGRALIRRRQLDLITCAHVVPHVLVQDLVEEYEDEYTLLIYRSGGKIEDRISHYMITGRAVREMGWRWPYCDSQPYLLYLHHNFYVGMDPVYDPTNARLRLPLLEVINLNFWAGVVHNAYLAGLMGGENRRRGPLEEESWEHIDWPAVHLFSRMTRSTATCMTMEEAINQNQDIESRIHMTDIERQVLYRILDRQKEDSVHYDSGEARLYAMLANAEPVPDLCVIPDAGNLELRDGEMRLPSFDRLYARLMENDKMFVKPPGYESNFDLMELTRAVNATVQSSIKTTSMIGSLRDVIETLHSTTIRDERTVAAIAKAINSKLGSATLNRVVDVCEQIIRRPVRASVATLRDSRLFLQLSSFLSPD